MQIIVSQCILAREAVFFVDPKNDEYLIHVFKKIADEAGIPLYIIDLTKDIKQFNIFLDANFRQIKSLLEAGFNLERTGKPSDFYKNADRDMAETIASIFKEGDTAESLYREHSKLMKKKAENFEGVFKDLASVTAINAKYGISFKKVVEDGGIVYVKGSMDGQDIKMVQRMLLIRVKQLAEERDRIASEPRKICYVLDEAQHHVSRTFIDAFGAARDKGMHLVLAHQGISDFKDNEAGLDGEAVFEKIFENTALKLIYKIQLPKTATVFAAKSGKIQIDDETRTVDKSLSLAESTTGGSKQIRQSESFFIDENMLMNLPFRCGVLFGSGQAKLIHTSPIQVKKTYEALVVKDYGEEFGDSEQDQNSQMGIYILDEK